jgi:hypothetical protein
MAIVAIIPSGAYHRPAAPGCQARTSPVHRTANQALTTPPAPGVIGSKSPVAFQRYFCSFSCPNTSIQQIGFLSHEHHIHLSPSRPIHLYAVGVPLARKVPRFRFRSSPNIHIHCVKSKCGVGVHRLPCSSIIDGFALPAKI